jgi:hypothetical protein
MVDTDYRALARASRESQGLSPTVTDPKVLNLLAALFGKPATDTKKRAA